MYPNEIEGALAVLRRAIIRGMEAVKLERKLRRLVGRAIADHDLIRPGDRIAVGLSGGKDSLCLLDLLLEMRRRAPIVFDLVVLTLDQGFPGYPVEAIRDHVSRLGLPLVEERVDVPGSHREGEDFCTYCARVRRGCLYRMARQAGCQALALAHHREDLIETFLMSVMLEGAIKTMPARLDATGEGRGLRLIRPLVYTPLSWIRAWAEIRGYPLGAHVCPPWAGGGHRRDWARRLVDRLEGEVKPFRGNVLAALGNLHPSQLLLHGAKLERAGRSLDEMRAREEASARAVHEHEEGRSK